MNLINQSLQGHRDFLKEFGTANVLDDTKTSFYENTGINAAFNYTPKPHSTNIFDNFMLIKMYFNSLYNVSYIGFMQENLIGQ